MNKLLEKALISSVRFSCNYERSRMVMRSLEKLSTFTHIYEFDIFNIPDKQHVLAHNHGFKILGNVADMYVLGPASPRPIYGLFYYKLFENPIRRAFLESWNAIPSNKIRRIQDYGKEGGIIALSPLGPEHLPSERGEMGAAWIAKTLQVPLIPTKIIQEKHYVRIEPRQEIIVPSDATKEDLREITDMVMAELKK